MRDDKRYTVSESADKIVLKTKVKRGTGTRDEDKLDVKVKGNDPDDVAYRLAETLDALDANRVIKTLRNTRAESDDD